MKKLFLLLLCTAALAWNASAQKDTTCTTVMKVIDLLSVKETRGQVKGDVVSVSQGSLGKVTTYKSKIDVPGMSNEALSEGMGRYFRAYRDAKTYDEAVKSIQDFHEVMHQCFGAGWTFTENNDPKELYSSYKITRDKDVLAAGSVKFFLERNGAEFRLVLEIAY